MRTTKQKGTSPEKYPDFSWINNDPEEVEIDYNADGSEFMPIFFVETKLTRLDSHWGTENFKFQLLRGSSGLMFVDASGELVVTYGGRTRKLVGAVTMMIPADTDFSDIFLNTNYSATALSEVTKNAAKKIGPAFGSKFNDRATIKNPSPQKKNGKQKPPAVKMNPDEKIQSQYNKAYEQKNGLVGVLENIYDIKYTGGKEHA